MMGSGGMGFGFGWIWMIVLVIGVGALVWGLARARSSSAGGNETSWGKDRSRDILRERYARGEITEEEMRERMRTLDGK